MAENKKQSKMAIFLLAGGLVNDAGAWRTTNLDEGDEFGVSGDRLRVIAANLLYRNKPGRLVIVSGGKGRLEDVLPDKITLASVIKGELVKIGVPAGDIIKEEKSRNTYQQLRQMQKIIKNRNFEDIIIISNKHHLPRLKVMIKYVQELLFLRRMFISGKIKIKSAESVVVKYEPKIWRAAINRAYKSRAMKKRIALEKRGARQIKDGTYKFI